MNYGEQSEQDSSRVGNDLQGSSPRNVPRRDGEQQQVERHEEDPHGIEAEFDEDDGAGNPQGLVERSISYQGPLPHSTELGNYEALSPGAATKLIDAHVFEKRAAANALTRITRAESFGVTFGAVVAGVLILGGLAAGVVLVLAGEPLAAGVFGALPVLSGSATGIISAAKGNSAK